MNILQMIRSKYVLTDSFFLGGGRKQICSNDNFVLQTLDVTIIQSNTVNINKLKWRSFR